MSFVPATVDLTGTNAILQGTTWVRDFAITNGGSAVVLTNYGGAGSPRAHFRATKSSATVLITPTMSIVAPATDGIIRMTITPAMTESLGTATLTGVYDVEIIHTDNSVERVLQGAWSLDPEVTHA